MTDNPCGLVALRQWWRLLQQWAAPSSVHVPTAGPEVPALKVKILILLTVRMRVNGNWYQLRPVETSSNWYQLEFRPGKHL